MDYSFFKQCPPLISLFSMAIYATLVGCGGGDMPTPNIHVDTVFIVNTDTVVVTETITEYEFVFYECSPETIDTENETQVVIQAECADLTDRWFIRREISGFTGAGYIIWEGSSNHRGRNAGNFGILEYEVPIPKSGTYRFNWRSYIGRIDPNSDRPHTEHNDSWLRIAGADDFYGEGDGTRVYPEGTGKTPNPEGNSGNGFFKVYMSRTDEWSEQSKTSDNNGLDVFARFDSPGTYTVEIAARSTWHAIDSFMLTLVE